MTADDSTLRTRAGRSPTRALLVRVLVVVLGLALFGTAAVSVRPLARDSRVAPDFIQFWTAATLLAAGRSPYDAEGQAAIQRELGWRKDVEGLGRYDFLPYYYPPWLGLATEALLPLGYPGARAAWLALNALALVGAALLLRGTARGVPPLAVVSFVVFFAPAVVAVLMGQVAPLVLLTVVGAWRLLDRRSDLGAGVLLAWLTIKPQLTIVLVVALLAWSIRRRRWHVPLGFAAALGAFVIASSLVAPSWFSAMLAATSATELPSYAFPWTGTTVFAILQTAGLRGAALWLCYLAAALPVVVAVARVALGARGRLDTLFGLGLLAPFFVATYARHYDFPILLVPALIVLARGSRRAGAALLAALLVLPYAHLALFAQMAAWCRVPAFPGPQVTYFWIPLFIAIGWLARTRGETPSSA
ncbi:MAG: glycosyltransferase family 87 protein [Bacteroidales bacterium]